jgi:uncharacterized protein YraI
MSKFRNAVAGLGLLAAMFLGTGTAMAAPVPVPGYTTTALDLKAGPGASYPVVATIPAGDSVTIYGCLSGWSWCDVGWQGDRGWAAGRYLEVLYEQHHQPILSYGHYFDLPFLSFSIGTYWQQHYHDRGFFSDMQRYQGANTGHKAPSKTQPPQTPLPQAGQPKNRLPKVEQPKAQLPHTQQPQAGQPKVRLPKVEQPKAQLPHTQLPQARQPKVRLPKVEQPKIKQPKAQQPKIQQPKIENPGIKLPNDGQSHGQNCAPGQNLVNGVCQ